MALADSQYASKIWKRYDNIAGLQHKSIKILHGSITRISCETRTATIKDHNAKSEHDHQYDYFIAATGLRRQWPSVPQSLQLSQYLQETGTHIENVTAAPHGVVVIGGGKM